MSSADEPVFLDPTNDGARLRMAMMCAARAVANSGDQDIFEVLVLGAAEALGVDLVFIGVLAGADGRAIRTIAVCDRGRVQPPFEYALGGTPCEHVLGQQFRFHPQNVQSLFPDPHLKEVGAAGYSAIPLFDSAGKAVGLMAVIDRKPLPDRELTECILRIFSVRAAVELERRDVDAARRLSEQNYRTIFEAAEDCLFIHDAATGAILDVNPKACEVYGYSRDELRRMDIGQLSSGVAPYTLEHAARLIEQAKVQGTVRMEWHRRNKDGSLHWDEVYIKPVRIGGAERILAVTREITERLRAEEERLRLEGQLRQAQKMEAIGQLTGGIAHDFNNILTSAMGYLSMARERAEQYADAKLDKYLDRVEAASQRAKELIAQMLTFSRGKRGEPRSLTLAPPLEEAVRLLQSTLPSSIEIRTDFARPVPCVLLDPLHIEQILMNLCINARDAMQGKGTLTIALRAAKLDGLVCASCHQPVKGAFVELAVADTGPGITAEVKERMFEPFFSTKEVGKGSGMGLAMVHGIVHEYGGHVGLECPDDGGLMIRVWLPAWFPSTAPSDEAAEIASQSVAEHRGGRLTGRILVTDDEAPVREFVKELMTSWGLQVELADNGVSACETLAADPDGFDLVLLDQTMPRMTGLEAAVQIGKLRPQLPVVLYTGHSEHLSEAAVRAAGIRALIKKPLDIPAFRKLIEQLIAGSPD